MGVVGIVLLGTIAMTPLMLLCNKYYKVPLHLILLSAMMLTVTGLLGGKLMFFIENGRWGSLSFFGAILFAPPMMYLVSKVIGASSEAILDLCGPTGCIFLAVQKINCLRTECCIGRVLGYTKDGMEVRFPSQILECAAALLIFIFLFWLITKEKYRGKILAYFLIAYGVSRFVLNLGRETVPFLFNLPPGNIWSIVAIIEGIVILILVSSKKKSSSDID